MYEKEHLMDTKPRWIEPGFLDRLYYLLVVPCAILASINTLVMLLFGVEAHYEMIYQLSLVASNLRTSISSTMLSAIDILPFAFFCAFAIVGSLPIRTWYSDYSKTPVGRYGQYRQEKRKSDVIELDPDKFTVN